MAQYRDGMITHRKGTILSERESRNCIATYSSFIPLSVIPEVLYEQGGREGEDAVVRVAAAHNRIQPGLGYVFVMAVAEPEKMWPKLVDPNGMSQKYICRLRQYSETSDGTTCSLEADVFDAAPAESNETQAWFIWEIDARITQKYQRTLHQWDVRGNRDRGEYRRFAEVSGGNANRLGPVVSLMHSGQRPVLTGVYDR